MSMMILSIFLKRVVLCMILAVQAMQQVSAQYAELQANLTNAKNTFLSLNGNENHFYGFIYSRKCGTCTPTDVRGPNLVIVKDGTIRNVTSQYLEPVDPLLLQNNGLILTIMDMFDLIQNAMSNSKGGIVEATFDSTYGYPTTFYIDYDINSVNDEEYYSITHFSPYNVWKQTYLDNYNKWQTTVIEQASSYVYTYERLCFCTPESLGPFEVIVENVDAGVATQVTNLVTDSVLDNTIWKIPTINELFTTIGEALLIEGDSNSYETNMGLPAYSVSVEYDKDYGYPRNIAIDYVELIADEEYYGYASNLILVMEATTTDGGNGDGGATVTSTDPPTTSSPTKSPTSSSPTEAPNVAVTGSPTTMAPSTTTSAPIVITATSQPTTESPQTTTTEPPSSMPTGGMMVESPTTTPPTSDSMTSSSANSTESPTESNMTFAPTNSSSPSASPTFTPSPTLTSSPTTNSSVSSDGSNLTSSAPSLSYNKVLGMKCTGIGLVFIVAAVHALLLL